MSAFLKTISGLQNLTNLTNFNADYNGITTIDFSGMTNLELIDISDCDIPGTNDPSLTQVDVTGCNSLQELRVDDSDFSQNGLASIVGLTNLPALELLDIDQCGLAGTIDLTSLPALRSIDINGNTGVTSLLITSAQPIDNLNAYNCQLSQANLNAIITALNANGVTNGYADFSGENMPSPSPSVNTAINQLELSKGWSLVFQAPVSVQWNVAADADPGVACADTNRTVNLFTASGSLTQGNTVYTNLLLTAYAADNTWYSDGTIRFQTINGVIQTPVACV